MMKFLSVFISVYLWLIISSVSATAQETITVAVASSFYHQTAILSKAFEDKHDMQVRLISGSTGRLYNQIKQGAPFDIFIAAGNDRGDLLKGEKNIIAHGYLGLKVDGHLYHDVHRLLMDNIKKIAIANPKVAPFGQAAQDYLKRTHTWTAIKPKLVYAQNAMQAGMMVNQGLVDAGFVATTDKKSSLVAIPYVAVLLSKHASARIFFSTLAHD